MTTQHSRYSEIHLRSEQSSNYFYCYSSETLFKKTKQKTRMAFNRAHSSAKDADIANLFNKRPVTHSPMRSARVSLNVTVTLA